MIQPMRQQGDRRTYGSKQWEISLLSGTRKTQMLGIWRIWKFERFGFKVFFFFFFNSHNKTSNDHYKQTLKPQTRIKPKLKKNIHNSTSQRNLFFVFSHQKQGNEMVEGKKKNPLSKFLLTQVFIQCLQCVRCWRSGLPRLPWVSTPLVGKQ